MKGLELLRQYLGFGLQQCSAHGFVFQTARERLDIRRKGEYRKEGMWMSKFEMIECRFLSTPSFGQPPRLPAPAFLHPHHTQSGSPNRPKMLIWMNDTLEKSNCEP